ncbi:methyltransferase [Candidatus Woesearchaeota archaeon]|nr:methyltransferase [Candidatus Woesearchaeota archaeon]
MYLPREDSFLLQKYVKEHSIGKVLDMGTGSGIQAATAATNKNVSKVLAVDINKKAVEHCKENIKSRKIVFKQSNLFSNIREKFDTIIFNPPYLPSDNYKPDIALIGGKKGHETIEKFLDSAGAHLDEDGFILLLFSSFTKKDKIDEIIEKNAFIYDKLVEKGVGLFEKLYVYLIKKSSILKKADEIGIKNMKRFTRGQRGVIYTGIYRNKKVAIKTQRPDVKVETIENEAKCLKILNKNKIGPKVVLSGKDYFVYEFVEGEFIEDFVEKTKTKKVITEILKEVMMQCRTLDKLEYNKEEMHHPYKHIIIGKDKKPVLVDFERCRKTKDPKNVSQFCQYLISGKMKHLLEEKGIIIDKKKIIELAKKYKKDFSEKNFGLILKSFH